MDPTALPPEIAHTMVAAGVIAGGIRLLVGVLRTPLLKDVWHRGPWYAKPGVLLASTVTLGTLDAVGFGQPWYLAIGAAITGLGGAVVTHEWQDLFKEAMVEKAEEDAVAAEVAADALRVAAIGALFDHTPPTGRPAQPDTIPDGKPTDFEPKN